MKKKIEKIQKKLFYNFYELTAQYEDDYIFGNLSKNRKNAKMC